MMTKQYRGSQKRRGGHMTTSTVSGHFRWWGRLGAKSLRFFPMVEAGRFVALQSTGGLLAMEFRMIAVQFSMQQPAIGERMICG